MKSSTPEQFDDLRAEIIEETAAPEGPRRPTPRAAKAADPFEMFDERTVADLIGFPFAIIADRKGAHWQLTEAERERIGVLANRVLSKRAPEWLKAWGDEIMLGVMLASAIGARLAVDARLAADREARGDRAWEPVPTGTPRITMAVPPGVEAVPL